MKIPRILNEKINKEVINVRERYDEIEKNTQMKNELPFLSIDLEKNKEFPNISHRLEDAKLLINTQTDKLLIEGFEGNEEDFKKCYHKLNPIQIKSISNIKHRRLNKFLIKDGYSGTIRLTKTKKFNLSASKKDRFLAQFCSPGHGNYQFKNIKLKKLNNHYFNNLFLDNSTQKSNQINSSNSINDKNIYNNSGSLYMNNIFNRSDSNSINRNYGSTFYFYKKNTERQNNSMKNIKNGSISLNAFITLRKILNDTSHNINKIDIKLKKYIKLNNLGELSPNSTKNKNKTTRYFHLKKTKDTKLRELLESFQKKEENTLKLIKKDEGVGSQNIWIKKSTANLISFGKAFLNLDDNQFYQERKRIMEDYPKIEKEANLSGEEYVAKEEDINKLKEQKIQMDKNSKIMNDLNNINNYIYKKLKAKIKAIKIKK